MSNEQQKKTMLDVNFINPFIDGTLETLKVQCSFVATAGKPYMKNQANPPKVDIASVIGLTSPNFVGSVSVCFPEKVFLIIMERMLGEKYEKITPELEDGAAELMNIIFGVAKKILNERNYSIDKAIPTIVRGAQLSVRHLTPNPTLVIPFTTDLGPFYIEIAIGV